MTMEVVVFGPCPPPIDGMSTITAEVLTVLNSIGVDVETVDLSPKNRHFPGSVSPARIAQTMRALWRLWSALRRHSKGSKVILYVTVGVGGDLGLIRTAMALALAHHYSCRLVTHIHTSGLPDRVYGQSRLIKDFVERQFQRVDVAIVLTKEAKEALRGIFPTCAVVPNFVDSPTTLPIPSRAIDGNLRLIFVGNLIRTKGYRLVVEAAGFLKSQGWLVTVHVAGRNMDSEWEQWWDQFRRAHEDPTFVSWDGMVTPAQRADLLQASDLFIYPSTYEEGVPLVLLEAAAAGVPILASRLPGICETFGDQVFYLEDVSREGIAKGVKTILSCSDLVGDRRRGAFAIAKNHSREAFRLALLSSLCVPMSGGTSVE